MEGELGVPLFDRLGRRVVLTDAGRTLLGYAERILDLHEEARGALSGGGSRPAAVGSDMEELVGLSEGLRGDERVREAVEGALRDATR